MWFKIYEMYNENGISEEIYEDCIKNRLTNRAEYIEDICGDYYEVQIYLQSVEELMEFIDCCDADVYINKNNSIEIIK